MTINEKSNSLFIKNFNDYISNLQEALGLLPFKDVNNLADLIYGSIISGNSIFIAGNGGSFANSMHIAADFSNTLHFLGQSCRFLSLGSNPAQVTATANDTNYSNIFVREFQSLSKAGDLLIILSGSGNSDNVIQLAEYSIKSSINCIGVVGFDGGKLKNICENLVHINVNDMEISEDLQLIVFHLIKNYLISKFQFSK